MNRQRFKTDFDDALKVVWVFNHVVANGPSPRRESHLPYGKGRIKNALVYIYAAIHSDSIRALIEKEYEAKSASEFLSKEFGQTIWNLIVTLPDFVVDEEADVVAWFRSLHVPLPSGPPETLTERLAIVAKEHKARLTAREVDFEQFAEKLHRWTAIQKRTYEEGNAYLEEAQKFDLF